MESGLSDSVSEDDFVNSFNKRVERKHKLNKRKSILDLSLLKQNAERQKTFTRHEEILHANRLLTHRKNILHNNTDSIKTLPIQNKERMETFTRHKEIQNANRLQTHRRNILPNNTDSIKILPIQNEERQETLTNRKGILHVSRRQIYRGKTISNKLHSKSMEVLNLNYQEKETYSNSNKVLNKYTKELPSIEMKKAIKHTRKHVPKAYSYKKNANKLESVNNRPSTKVVTTKQLSSLFRQLTITNR